MTQPDREESETDVASDDKVASSRASTEDDGDYVGRTGADDDIDTEESGAEARSDDG